jgi:NADH pyrophosphatase NudC (nudix superfamily)
MVPWQGWSQTQTRVPRRTATGLEEPCLHRMRQAFGLLLADALATDHGPAEASLGSGLRTLTRGEREMFYCEECGDHRHVYRVEGKMLCPTCRASLWRQRC